MSRISKAESDQAQRFARERPQSISHDSELADLRQEAAEEAAREEDAETERWIEQAEETE